MEKELAELKVELRSLVVSSPTPVSAHSLQYEYREMIGRPLPFQKFGYRDVLTFLKERLSDCFVLDGNLRNPTLVPIVPKQLKHIDQMISKQKLSAKDKFKGKRRSIMDTTPSPAPPPSNITSGPYMAPHIRERTQSSQVPNKQSPPSSKYTSISPSALFEAHRGHLRSTNNIVESSRNNQPDISYTDNNIESSKINQPKTSYKENNIENTNQFNRSYSDVESSRISQPRMNLSARSPVVPIRASVNGISEVGFSLRQISPQQLPNNRPRMRTPLIRASTTSIDTKSDTSYDTSSSKVRVLDDIKPRLHILMQENPDGIWCVDLMTLYKKRFNLELSFSAAGCSSLISLVRRLPDIFTVERPDPAGDWRLYDVARPPPPPRLRPHPQIPKLHTSALTVRYPDEDALPGVPYEAGVFPEDCMQCGESIPRMSLVGVVAGDQLDMQPGEVYSPSHFWLMRLGEEYYSALDQMMDNMNVYYRGEGADRRLSLGAVKEGQFVSAYYSSDWHRAVIVNILDSDNVKLRYIDFGTIEKVAVYSLKPLLKTYSKLPAQAIRARLAGVKPPAGGKAWPPTSCSAFLSAVINKKLVAQIVSVDVDDDILEVYLVDTNTEEDICINEQLILNGYADRHFESYLHVSVPPIECDSDYSDDLNMPEPPSPPPLERQRALFHQLPDAKIFDRIVKIVSLENDNPLDTSLNSSNSVSSLSTVKVGKTKSLMITVNNTTKNELNPSVNNKQTDIKKTIDPITVDNTNKVTMTPNIGKTIEPIKIPITNRIQKLLEYHKSIDPITAVDNKVDEAKKTSNVDETIERVGTPDSSKSTYNPVRLQKLLELRQKMLGNTCESTNSVETELSDTKKDLKMDRIATLLSLHNKINS